MEESLPYPGIIAPGDFFSNASACTITITYNDKLLGVFYDIYIYDFQLM